MGKDPITEHNPKDLQTCANVEKNAGAAPGNLLPVKVERARGQKADAVGSLAPNFAPVPSGHLPIASLTALSAALLAACGGGGSGGAAPGAANGVNTSGATAVSAAAPGFNNVPKALTDADAARFLLQSELSASDEAILALRNTTFAAYVQNQFALPMGQTGHQWLESRTYGQANVYRYFFSE